MDQWNRTESPEINPHTYGQLIFDKGGKNIQRGKDSLFSKWCWESWTAFTIHKNKLKMVKDLNIRHGTIKLLKEITGKTFSDINSTIVFLGQSPRPMEIKTKINKWNLIKFTSFCTSKETINKKTTYRMGENICK